MTTKTLLKSIILTTVLFILSLNIFTTANAEPADGDFVYATEQGGKWHAYRDCGHIFDKNTWRITYANAKKISKIDGECSDCLNGNNRNQTVTAKTYQYTNSFITSIEINWETGEEMTSSSDTSTASSAVVLSSASESSNTATTASASNSTIATNNSASSSQSSSGNVVTINTSSGSSSSFSDLMTESQRRKSFSSKINPKRGTTPVTQVRPDSAGYKYASFGTYNSYASDNKLGNTPIYLLGTIMSINKVGQSNSHYKLAIMVNDCDGYQWYMRATCLKDNFELLKSEINGKAAYMYGTYAGYSGVTNRPMMDVKNVFVVDGNAVSIALYQ